MTSFVNGLWHNAEFPARIALHSLVIILIQTASVCLFAFCPYQFPIIRGGLCSLLFHCDSSPACMTSSKERCFQTWTRPSPPPPTMTRNGAFSPGMCSHQQADLVAAPDAPPGDSPWKASGPALTLGRSRGPQTQTIAPLRRTCVTLLKARPDWRSERMAVDKKEKGIKSCIWLTN